jgi:hypothetical protein
MCWNAEISLNTFIFGFISSIIVYILGYIENGLIILLLSFTSIQLLEYFIWKYIDNKEINEILSKIGLFIIGIQIFLLCFFYKNKKIRKYLLYLYFIFVILFIIIELRNIEFRSIKGDNGHLRWLWLDFNIIWIIIFTSFYLITMFPYKNNSNIIKFLFVLITLIISLYYYYKNKTWGSMWCYFSNILWIFLIIYSIFNHINNYQFV